MNTKEVPAHALRCSIGTFELGDNGEDAKSAPIKMLIRSKNPIDHWWWGRVVHDLAGMKLHKNRVPIDYCHNSGEIMGYLNKFSDGDKGKEASGALVPYKEKDRATEVIFKQRAGVPYEASINFAGDGILIEEVGENAVAEVNGEQFKGPGIIVREWPLRGVAVCPYGADMNTNSEFSSESTFAVSVQGKEDVMAFNEKEAKEREEAAKELAAVEAKKKEEAAKELAAVEAKKKEEAAKELAAVEAKKEEAKKKEEAAKELAAVEAKAECQKFIDAYGENGGKWFAEGVTFEQAKEKHFAEIQKDRDALKESNDKLRARLTAIGDDGEEALSTGSADGAAATGETDGKKKFDERCAEHAKAKGVKFYAAVDALRKKFPTEYAEMRKTGITQQRVNELMAE